MRILSQVFLLLAVTINATCGSQPHPDRPAQKDIDKAIKVSLMRVKMSYVENLRCVTLEKLNLRLEVDRLVPGLMDTSRPEFFSGDSQGSFVEDDPDLYTGNVTVERQAISNLKYDIKLIDEIFKEMEEAFHSHRDIIKQKHGSEQAASSLAKLEEVLAAVVQDAKSIFSTGCKLVKWLADFTINNLKRHVSTL